MQIQEKQEVNRSQELVLTSQNNDIALYQHENSYLLQQFQNSQLALLQSYEQQNSWLRYWFWLSFGIILLIFIISAVFIYFYFLRSKDVEKKISQEIENSRREFSQKMYEHMVWINLQEQKYRGDWEKLHQRETNLYQNFNNLLLQTQEKYQKQQKENEEKILELEKEKLAYLQKNQQLTTINTNLELNLTKAAAQIKALQEKQNVLQKKLEEAEQQIRYWKSKAMDKLTTEELEKLSKDLKRDY